MLPDIRDYDRLVAAFRWHIPERYNIGVDVCDRWAAAEPERLAVLDVAAERARRRRSPTARCATRSNRLANALAARGVARGDRVAILLPQGDRRAVAHVADLQARRGRAAARGRCSASTRSSYRLRDAGAKALITNAAGLAKLAADSSRRCRTSRPSSRVDGPDGGAPGLPRRSRRASADFAPVDTAADDPAMMIYTSGTTGQPKGALHAHRVLLGHLPGVQMPHEFLPQAGRPPLDAGRLGLGRRASSTCSCPASIFGVPVVARKFDKFDPEEAFRLMADHEVRNTFVPPTALRMLRTVANPARALRPAPAHHRLRRRGARRRDLRLGPRGAGPHHQRVLRPDRVQPRARPPAPRSASRGRARSASRCRATRSAIIREDGSALRAGRARPDRGAAPRSGDVPRLLEQARGDGGEVRRRLDDHRRPGHASTRTATSASSAATTTSSPPPATASARARSRIASSAIPPSRSPRRSASRTRCAPRSSRPSWC